MAEPSSIVVAEEDAFFADILVHLLERNGFRAVSVSTVREAIESLDQTPACLFIVSAQLPVPDGHALVAEIRKRPSLAHLPVIVTIDPEDEDDLKRTLAGGMDDVLLKPLVPLEVMYRVRRQLRAGRVRGS